MSQKVLITGISGFAGSHLAEYLVSQKRYDITGTYLSESSLKNLSNIRDKVQLTQIDLTNADAVSKLITSVRPDLLFHLAALPSPAGSYKNPTQYLQNNINAEVNLLEALKNEQMTSTRVLVISSSEIYGLVSTGDLPIDEDTPLKPVSPYGVSKIAQDYLGLQYFLAHKLSIVRSRPFGHLGPRLSEQFVASAFSKKIAEIEKQKREPVLTVGNLEAKRDLTDVRDMVKAYELLLVKGKLGEVYNIGSGVSYKIKNLLDMLLSFSEVKITIKTDSELFRPNDIPELLCDNTKMSKLTGWKPTIPIKESLKDTLDYWRSIV